MVYSLTSATECSCKSSFDSNHCTECSTGCHLYLDFPEGAVVPSLICKPDDVPNCHFQDENICVQCNDGYYLKDNECKDCNSLINGCKYCNDTKCFICDKDAEGKQLYLSNTQDKCIDCSDSNNAELCGRCNDGSYFDSATRSCQKCFNNCELCTSSTNCFKCSNKTILTESNSLYECIPIDNCDPVYSKDDHCEKCIDGYYLKNGKCFKCQDGCNVCYEDTQSNSLKCSECEHDKIMNSGSCSDASSLHCLQGSPIFGCTECEKGYYFGLDYTCQKCSSNCSTCVGTSDHCLSCSTNYYFVKGKTTCVHMDSHCRLADESGCKECNNELVIEHQNDSGYYIPEGSQTCQPCEEHCKLCEKESNHCTACIDNYLLKKVDDTNGNYHYECIENDKKTCVSTEMGYCTECIAKHFIATSADGLEQECTSCDISCDTCEKNNSCLTCAKDYYLPRNYTGNKVNSLCKQQSEINMTCQAGTSGCEVCNDGYWINLDDNTQANCTVCPSGCSKCQWSTNEQRVICLLCDTEDQYVKNGECFSCNELEHCATCSGDKCATCEDGYSLDAGSMSCSKTNWGLIIPLIVIAVIIIIIILIVIIGIIWWRRRKSVKAESTAIKPFHVSSDLELMLLGADNEKFPLKTDKWELTFNLVKSKAVVDQEYEETVNLANMSKKEYYFEFHYTPSHRYDIIITPNNSTLKPGNAIQVRFKIKILCTCSLSDQLGISAMDVDDQTKETAAFTIIIESDLSLKLDHTELKPIMPPIGEGAFGMVFRGTYRGREVAIKKMKARNLTQEQEKEFNHEVSMMTQLRHICVVELIGAVYTEGEISIVTEFAEYGSLSKIWGKQKISYQLKIKLLDDMAVALSYLHQNQILHRDVKGENLLIFSLNPHSPVCAKLTDFGTCRNVSERNLSAKELSQGIGTPTYMAPECLQNSTDYSYPVDVYAYGIVLYETYVEHNAYDGDERFNQPWMIPQFVIEGNRLSKPNGIPDNYWELTTKCWSQNPEDRPKFVDILKTIESWGEDIRYAFNVEVDKKIQGSDASSSTSVPSSAQEPSTNSTSTPRDDKPSSSSEQKTSNESKKKSENTNQEELKEIILNEQLQQSSSSSSSSGSTSSSN
ncbi:hypothetical protein ENUP19_0062G0033 [Entamoeba nuttalli]|uniref:Protein kinase domain-containing protein n=1 Tax=Entamoeba nuttalli TaxID=412467 RepID=A0ABQ0DDV4_9EUKA